MEIVILKLLKVLILLSVSSLLLQVCLKCKLNWLLSLIPVQSCRFLIQLLCWEHTQVLGVSSEVPFLLSLSDTHFFFAWNSSFTWHSPCRASFQGNCLQSKDPIQRSTMQCGMYGKFSLMRRCVVVHIYILVSLNIQCKEEQTLKHLKFMKNILCSILSSKWISWIDFSRTS